MKALDKVLSSKGVNIYNLGTGKGVSVLTLVKTFEEVNGVTVQYVITERRPGDIAACYADATKAKEELGWEAKFDLAKMCEDAYRFLQKNKD